MSAFPTTKAAAASPYKFQCNPEDGLPLSRPKRYNHCVGEGGVQREHGLCANPLLTSSIILEMLLVALCPPVGSPPC